MRYKDGTLILNPTDLDHVMIDAYPYDDGSPSELFKQGLDDELFLSGLEDKEIIKLEIYLDWRRWLNKMKEMEK